MTTASTSSTPSRREQDFISVTRLLMICGLVYHHLFEIPGSSHSPRTSLKNAEHFLPEFINAFFHMATMTAVPLLSVISGFLFFRRQRLDYRSLLLRRLQTVALPTWLWSLLWLGCAWFLYTLAGAGGGFGWANYGFDTPSGMTLINGIFGVTQQPFAFQFWFVHDLLLTLLLTPIIHFMLKMLGWRLLPAMAIGWLLVPYPPVFFSGNVLMFFTVGAWLALPTSPGLAPTLELLGKYRWSLLLLFGSSLVARIMAHRFGALEAPLQSYIYLCLLRIAGVLTLASLLHELVVTQPALTRSISRYSGCSFFIFAMHYPLLELLQEAAVLVPGHASGTGMALSWLLVPLLTIGLAITSALSCERRLPALFTVLNGGRSTDTVQRVPGITLQVTNNS